MVVLAGGKPYPLAGSLTIADNIARSQFPPYVQGPQSSVQNGFTCRLAATVFNRCAPFYVGLLTGNSGSPSYSAGMSVNPLSVVVVAEGNWVGSADSGVSILGTSLAKGATNPELTCSAQNVSGGGHTLAAVLYKDVAVAAESISNGGVNFIAGGGNPETDYAGAPGWTGQLDSGVFPILGPAPGSYDAFFLYLYSTWNWDGTSDNTTDNFQIWNWTTNTWVAMNGLRPGINTSTIAQRNHWWFAGLTADFIGGIDNRIYIRMGPYNRTAIGSQSNNFANARLYYGSLNPRD